MKTHIWMVKMHSDDISTVENINVMQNYVCTHFPYKVKWNSPPTLPHHASRLGAPSAWDWKNY
jgi:hypothetical protein